MSVANLVRTEAGHIILEENGRKFLMSCLYDVEIASDTVLSERITVMNRNKKMGYSMNTQKYLNKQKQILQHKRVTA